MEIDFKKHITYKNLLLLLTAIVSIGTILALFSGLSDYNFSIFFCTDTLYLPSIYKDLFIDHNSLQGWHFNPSPNIFPDMIFYFLLNAITSDFIIASFVFALLQYLFFIYLIFRLFKAIDLPNTKLITTISSLLLLLFFMVTFYSNDFSFTFYLVSNSYHTGAFLMSLLCTILTIEYLKYNKTKTLIIIGIISLLCVASDRLFVVLYSIPWLLFMVMYLKLENHKRLIWINCVNVAAVALGMLAFHYMDNNKYIFIDKPNRIMEYKYHTESFNLLMSQMYNYLKDWNYKSLIIIISSLTFLSIIVISIKKLFSQKKFTLKHSYYVFSIIFTLVVFLAPVINGSYTGYDTFRYNIYVFYLLIINFGVIIYLFIEKINIIPVKFINGLIIILLFLASFNIVKQYSNKGLKDYFTYYPKYVRSIDSISKREKLYCGLGNYWKAKVVTMFSKNNVRVYTSINALSLWDHVMNDNWYIKNRFNFIISDDETQDTLISKYFNNNTRLIKSDDLRLVITPEFVTNRSGTEIEKEDR
jgi:hypothetical protein